MIYKDLLDKKSSLAVVGLGYVGLPLAYGFSKRVNTVGFDISKFKIERYKKGVDVTKEIRQNIRSKNKNFL
jgi:UDP-N-acetyl-D-galactosamine dehydrogenase